MKKILLTVSVFCLLFLVACQKDIDWGLSGGSGGSGGGSTNGDLLVKALQITPATHDTNVITFQWDANKRLLAYHSTGKVNSIVTDLHYTISRLSDGKIARIVYKSSASGGLFDSTVYEPHYLASGKLSYVIDTQFSVVTTLRDSAAFLYDAAGQVSSKELFIDFLGMMPVSKETYTYDANGNVLTINAFSTDGAGGYDPASTITITYDAHKNAAVLGEESYIMLGASNTAKNNPTKQVTNAITTGTSYTATFTQQQFNSFDRPFQSLLGVTPQPPGYDLKILYYYQ